MEHISCRPHGLTVFFSLTKYFWVLFIPILRTVLALGFDLENAFRGFEADIAVILLLTLNSLSRWLLCKITVSESGVELVRGVLLKKKISLSYDDMSCLKIWQNPFTALFKCCALRIYTECDSQPAVRLYCKAQTADLLSRTAVKDTAELQGRCGLKKALLYAVISSGSAGGLLFLSAAMSAVGVAAGKGLSSIAAENIGYIYEILQSVPRLLIVGGITAFVGWLTSFVMNTLSVLFQRVYKGENRLFVMHGAVKRIISRTDARPDCLILSKSIFLRKKGSLFMYRRGYGEGKYDSNLLLVLCGREEINGTIKSLVGDIRSAGEIIRPAKSAAVRFVTVPLVFFGVACFTSGLGLSCGIFGDLRFFALFLPLPFLWRIICGAYEWYCEFLADCGEKFTIGYVRRSKKRTAVFYKDRCGKISLTQNPFQRRRNTANMRFYINAARRERTLVRHTDLKKCTDFAEACR